MVLRGDSVISSLDVGVADRLINPDALDVPRRLVDGVSLRSNEIVTITVAVADCEGLDDASNGVDEGIELKLGPPEPVAVDDDLRELEDREVGEGVDDPLSSLVGDEEAVEERRRDVVPPLMSESDGLGDCTEVEDAQLDDVAVSEIDSVGVSEGIEDAEGDSEKVNSIGVAVVDIESQAGGEAE